MSYRNELWQIRFRPLLRISNNKPRNMPPYECRTEILCGEVSGIHLQNFYDPNANEGRTLPFAKAESEENSVIRNFFTTATDRNGAK